MSKFKVGDRVTVSTSNKNGVIRAIFEDHSQWAENGSIWEYSVELDGGEGAVALVEKVLKLEYEPYKKPTCHCGLNSIREGGGRHSSYCPLYSKFDY